MRSLLLALLVSGCATATQQTAESEIQQAEARLAEALTRQDVAAIDRLWSDDFVFVAPNGKISNKQQRLEGMKPLAPGVVPGLVNRNDRVVVRVYRDCAVATVLSSWQGANAATGDQYQATHVWMKEKGRWRMVAAQVAQLKHP